MSIRNILSKIFMRDGKKKDFNNDICDKIYYENLRKDIYLTHIDMMNQDFSKINDIFINYIRVNYQLPSVFNLSFNNDEIETIIPCDIKKCADIVLQNINKDIKVSDVKNSVILIDNVHADIILRDVNNCYCYAENTHRNIKIQYCNNTIFICNLIHGSMFCNDNNNIKVIHKDRVRYISAEQDISNIDCKFYPIDSIEFEEEFYK